MSTTMLIDASFEDGVFVPEKPVWGVRPLQRVQLRVTVLDESTRPILGPLDSEGISVPFDLPRDGEPRSVETVLRETRMPDPDFINELG